VREKEKDRLFGTNTRNGITFTSKMRENRCEFQKDKISAVEICG